MQMELSSFLSRIESQSFGKRLLSQGIEALDQVLNLDQVQEDEHLCAMMTAEVIAASIGHPAHPESWCFFAEKWLYHSKFIASEEYVSQATAMLEKMVFVDHQLETEKGELKARLSMKPKKVKWGDPSLTSGKAKKLARSFGEKGSNDVKANGLFGQVPSPAEAVAIIAFREFKEFTLMFDEYPSPTRIEALRILLLGASETLEEFRCRYGHAVFRTEPDTDPNKTLHYCLDEIKNLSKLDIFLITDLYVDDQVLQAAAHRGLSCFRARVQDKRFKHQVEVTSKGIEALLQCELLELVDIRSPHLRQEDGRSLLEKFPDLTLMGVPS